MSFSPRTQRNPQAKDIHLLTTPVGKEGTRMIIPILQEMREYDVNYMLKIKLEAEI